MFAVQVLTDPATLTDADIDELKAYRHSDRDLAEVVGLVTLNLMTGAFNLVAGLEPREDDQPAAAAGVERQAA